MSLPETAPSIGIVTVTYNSGRVMAGFLRSLWAQTHGRFTLFVVDNASSDDTLAQVAAAADPRVVVLANPDNRGVAGGNNQGIRAALEAGCDSVLLINNDTEFEPELLAKLAAGLERHCCDMIVPKMFYYDAPDVIWCAGGTFTPWKAYSGAHFGKNERDAGQHDSPRPSPYSPTCCMLIRIEVFARIGLMDELYFTYYDDADFCFQAWRAGLRLFYLPEATMQHKVSSLTGGLESPFTIRYTTRNRVYFLRKNLSRWLQPFWLLGLQGWFLMRLARGRDTWAVFQLRRRSFREGCRLSLAAAQGEAR